MYIFSSLKIGKIGKQFQIKIRKKWLLHRLDKDFLATVLLDQRYLGQKSFVQRHFGHRHFSQSDFSAKATLWPKTFLLNLLGKWYFGQNYFSQIIYRIFFIGIQLFQKIKEKNVGRNAFGQNIVTIIVDLAKMSL